MDIESIVLWLVPSTHYASVRIISAGKAIHVLTFTIWVHWSFIRNEYSILIIVLKTFKVGPSISYEPEPGDHTGAPLANSITTAITVPCGCMSLLTLVRV